MRILIALLTGSCLFGQLAEHANENYKTEAGRAKVASTLTGADRDARQRPKELIQALGLKSGMTVADIGTGPGYLLPFLNEAVGAEGKVIAEDVFPDYLAMAKKKVNDLRNVEFILGNEKSTNLPPRSTDVALMLDVYHHLNYPKEVLASISAALATKGRLVIVEYHQNDGSQTGLPAKGHVRLSEQDAIKEIESFGWKLVERRDFAPNIQWMGIFVPAQTAADAWWSHVLLLADDKLEGRKAGSAGHAKATAYVEEQFRLAGLKPANGNSFLQPVGFEMRQLQESGALLEVIGPSGPQKMILKEQAIVGTAGESGNTVEAEAVFVGHGLQISEMKIDDLAGLDLKGKFAVVLRGAPSSVPGPFASHLNSELGKRLKRAGAIGVASLFNQAKTEIPWARGAMSRVQPVLQLADPVIADTAVFQASMTFGESGADVLLAGSGHTLAELIELDKKGGSLPKFPLKTKIRVRPSFTKSTVTSHNVAGILPGSDPVLKSEYVVLSAHVDHLGVGAPVQGDSIYNGALDNAAGVASLIEIAKQTQGKSFKRSILFAAVTGEESGLLGSRFLAMSSLLPPKSIAADLNMDMILPIVPMEALTVYGLEESTLGPLIKDVGQRHAVRMEIDPEPQFNRFVRSDQYSFIRVGIPALSFTSRARAGSEGEQLLRKWRSERYHSPSDDVNQPVIPASAVKFNEIIADLLEKVGNLSDRPRWNDTSVFRDVGKDVPASTRSAN